MADQEQSRQERGGIRDFFVSFTDADRAWAEWIAWTLEEAKYSVWFQHWDFRGNFIEQMDVRIVRPTHAHRLSDAFLKSGFALSEWSARLAQDRWTRTRSCRPRSLPLRTRPYFAPSFMPTGRL